MIKLYLSRCTLVLVVILLTCIQALPQTLQKVSGKVISSDESLSLPGVNIIEKGTSNGTVTDGDGNYSIQVKDNAVLVFSFVGYRSQEITVGGQSQININLAPDVSTLDEVMIVGYGTAKKTDVTGSLTTIDGSTFNKGVVNAPQDLITGKTAGVLVTSNSGAPGNTSTIRIRGGSSLSASNDPLIVIDGVPISNTNLGGSPNILSTINPSDIESYTVLKDASATAIYGLRASNGVIIITTKRGGRDMKISYNVTGTLFTAPNKVDVYDGNEYRALINRELAGNPEAIALLGTENTDWQSEIYNTSSFGHDHSLSLSGTAKKTPYRLSFGYNDTDGILKSYNFNRTTLALGADPSLFNDRLKVNINVKAMLNKNNFADQGAIGTAVGYDPTRPVHNGNTRWRGYTSWTQGDINAAPNSLAPGNPVALLELTDNTSTVKRSIGNIKFDYDLPLIKNLKATLNLGYDYAETKGHNNVPDSTQWTPNGEGRYNPYSSKAQNELLDFYLTWAPKMNSASHKVDVMAGYSWSHFYSSGGDSTMNVKQEGPADRVNVYESEFYLISFFGRLNYAFKDKFLFTATLRDDGTSRFKKENRFGFFPSVGLGWKLSKEKFLADSETISELKLRVGYGKTGQQDIVGNDYPYIATYTRSDNAARYQFGDTYYNTLRPDAYNENIRWETAETVNAGLDFGFLQNLITGSVDVYRKQSSDLISYVPPAQGTNFGSSVISNVGNITNHGIEVNLSADVISRDDIQWTIGYNVTYNVNEVTKLTLNNDPKFFVPVGTVGGTTSGTIQAHKVGNPRSSFYVYQQAYDVDGKPVEDVYIDRNNDGIINTSDLYIYKKPDPTVYMGINSRFAYKNFDFAFSGRASFGNYIYNNVAANSTYRALYDIGILSNVSKHAEKTQFNPATNTRFSDFYIENGSFFRMDNINAGYTFNKIAREKSSLRVGAGVQNAFVITKYTGIDPEISGGLDNNFFPRTRSFFLSLNFQY